VAEVRDDLRYIQRVYSFPLDVVNW